MSDKEKEKEKKEDIIYGLLKNNLKVISINKIPFLIGRSEKCNLYINNPSISKRHALIQFDIEDNDNLKNKDQNIILIDNSLNGTYVNGTKIVNGKKILLETGDKISFGNDKNIFVFELMNYDHNKTIVYPNLIEFEKIENQPISLVNENNYKKPEINHLNIGLDTINVEKNNLLEHKDINILQKDDNLNDNKIDNKNNINDNNQIFSLNQEIFNLRKENDELKKEIINLKEIIDKNNTNKINNSDVYSLNNSNINLLTDDIRELGLFRRIKECLVPNYPDLSFDELSNKFDEIIIEYKRKYNIEEIIINMENEFNNEISKFNNIISMQQEQKRDSLNKINYIFNKENNLDENSKYSKINKYLMEELNQLISDKETNIKIINQLKGNLIKLKTEFNLYKANYNKKTIKIISKNKKETEDKKENNNIPNQNNKNNIIEENKVKSYIDYNIDKYNFLYDYNKYYKNKTENKYNKPFNENNTLDYNNNRMDNFKENDGNNRINNDDIQRLNILLENSQDNQKYHEIIKQRKMIENSN